VIPLILIIFAIAGYILSSSTGLWDKVVVYIQNLIPVSSERIINNTQRLIEDRTLIGIIGLVGMAFTATRLFASLRTVLDYVFEIKHTRGIIHGQLFDFTMLLLMSMIALVANLIFHFLPRLFRESILFNNRIFSLLPLFDSSIVGIVLTFFLTVGLLFISYKFFPSKKMNNDTCLIATLIAAVFIEITKYIYGWFLSMYPQINRVYGTLGAIVALIFWFYISSVVYVAAAEIAFIRESGQRQLLDR
ncbi:MAG: YihY/virulence factor BrkB family protein, partial [Candidatus Glassbacteria bacterium]